MYVTENEKHPNFADSSELIWLEKGLVYGDWYSGPNGDGIHEITTTIRPSKVAPVTIAVD